MEYQYRPWTVALVFGSMQDVTIAEDPVPTAESIDPAVLAKDLAAVKAFRKLVAGQSYQLADEKVREIVLEYLKRNGSGDAKQMPTAEQIEGNLALDFEAIWSSLTKRATAGLDPDGQLGLEERLTDFLNRKTQLRAEAQKRYNAYLKNGLPSALLRVGRHLVKEQNVALRKALVETLAADHISQERICRAFNGESNSVLEELAAEVTKRLPRATRNTLLVDAANNLTTDIEKIIEDGVGQLKEQMLLLELRPEAVSLPGMEKEFAKKLRLLSKDQKRQRAENPLRPAYGEFACAAEGMKKAAKRWFDERVAMQGTAVTDALVQGTLVPARQDADQFRDLILGAPARHQNPEASWHVLQPAILATCDNARIWITSPLETARGQSTSQIDREYSAAAFREDVRTAMESEGTKAHAAWRSLTDTLKTHFKEKLLPELRSQIAQEQATRYAPELVRGKWVPTERELTAHRTPLDETALTRLSVWEGRPPKLAAVLEETWCLWKQQADKAFAIGENALRGQAGLVTKMEPTILTEMRSDEDDDPGKWTVRYTSAVASKWKKDRSDAATRYPELFKGTKDMIVGIVAKLIEKVAQEREAAAARAIAEEKAKEEGLPGESEEAPSNEIAGAVEEGERTAFPGSLLPSTMDLPIGEDTGMHNRVGGGPATESGPLDASNDEGGSDVARSEDVIGRFKIVH